MSKESALAALTSTVSTPVVAEKPPTPAEVTTTETKPTEGTPVVAEATQPEGAPSTHFASIAKKEAKLVKDRQEFLKQAEDFKKDRESFEGTTKAEAIKVLEQAKAFEELKAKDPVAALKSLGFTETDIVNFMAAQEEAQASPAEIAAKAAAEEIRKFKEEQEGKTKTEQEKKELAVLEKFRADITATVASDTAAFEYCAWKGKDAEALIYATVQETLMKEGKMLSAKEAAELVEKYYEDYYGEEFKAVTALKKWQPKGTEPVATTEVAPAAERTRVVTDYEGKEVEAPKPKSRTLSNSTTATLASSVNARETREEKRARLEAALRRGPTA